MDLTTQNTVIVPAPGAFHAETQITSPNPVGGLRLRSTRPAPGFRANTALLVVTVVAKFRLV